ncbi:hypothetical protein ACFOMD_00200 [Sphingoaurantiacus capsulatus]|uniref:Uncharacterized protein n=1 Tax=Sphingoaurantiacus capsulatus TaxID=1771310 RepID=A0ABV7X5E9_9SPHN
MKMLYFGADIGKLRGSRLKTANSSFIYGKNATLNGLRQPPNWLNRENHMIHDWKYFSDQLARKTALVLNTGL